MEKIHSKVIIIMTDHLQKLFPKTWPSWMKRAFQISRFENVVAVTD